jgi:hypothetical protein
MAMWEKAQKLKQIAGYYERARVAHQNRQFLSAARWEELARWERAQLDARLAVRPQ